MHFYLIAVASLIHSKSAVFTYHSTDVLPNGALVRVPVGRNFANGVVLSSTLKPTFATKPVEEWLYQGYELPPQLLSLCEWIATYYASHLGLVLQSALPTGIHKNRRASKDAQTIPLREHKDISLTDEQRAAIANINTSDSHAHLLHGVPGSGKTQVYIELAKQQLAENKSVVLLVPEIALTTQLIAEFSLHFPHVVVTHSGMSEAERHKAWESVLTAEQPQIVIGPRSALFSPVKNLGMIIIDECHEQSFKQDRSPRYHAAHASSILTKLHRAKIVLGSATPNVADLHLAHLERLSLSEMPTAIQQRANEVTIVNHKTKDSFTKHRFVSNELVQAIEKALANGEQALIFHNRRGTAPVVICEECGWRALCPNCELPLTFHGDSLQTRCHACDHTQPVIHACPECHNPTIIFKGIGTKLVEDEFIKLFPQARIARFDADNAKEHSLQARYQELYDKKIDILIGTQIIAKGLDIPGITTVGILQADSGLNLPDFAANERTFQLLYQVSGRAGRDIKPGHVILQTYLPDNPVIQWAAHRDFASFAEAELASRQRFGYPPFRYLLKLTSSFATEKGAINATRNMAKKIRAEFPGVEVVGPAPDFYEKKNNKYHWQLLIKSTKRAPLQQIMQLAPTGNWQADIDPVSLL